MKLRDVAEHQFTRWTFGSAQKRVTGEGSSTKAIGKFWRVSVNHEYGLEEEQEEEEEGERWIGIRDPGGERGSEVLKSGQRAPSIYCTGTKANALSYSPSSSFRARGLAVSFRLRTRRRLMAALLFPKRRGQMPDHAPSPLAALQRGRPDGETWASERLRSLRYLYSLLTMA